MSSLWIVLIVVVAAVILLFGLINLALRREGYSIPGNTIVRCSKGHLFTTIWIAGGSLKAIRISPRTRYQHCPVGNHWTIVHPVKDDELTDDERRSAAEHH